MRKLCYKHIETIFWIKKKRKKKKLAMTVDATIEEKIHQIVVSYGKIVVFELKTMVLKSAKFGDFSKNG